MAGDRGVARLAKATSLGCAARLALTSPSPHATHKSEGNPL
jgi:hypothetical protein